MIRCISIKVTILTRIEHIISHTSKNMLFKVYYKKYYNYAMYFSTTKKNSNYEWKWKKIKNRKRERNDASEKEALRQKKFQTLLSLLGSDSGGNVALFDFTTLINLTMRLVWYWNLVVQKQQNTREPKKPINFKSNF